MSHLTEIENKFGPNHDELIFPCDCGDGDYLRITWDEDPDWRWLWIESAHLSRRTTWRQRLLRSARCLFGRDYARTEVILTDESMASLREFLAHRSPSPNAPGDIS